MTQEVRSDAHSGSFGHFNPNLYFITLFLSSGMSHASKCCSYKYTSLQLLQEDELHPCSTALKPTCFMLLHLTLAQKKKSEQLLFRILKSQGARQRSAPRAAFVQIDQYITTGAQQNSSFHRANASTTPKHISLHLPFAGTRHRLCRLPRVNTIKSSKFLQTIN